MRSSSHHPDNNNVDVVVVVKVKHMKNRLTYKLIFLVKLLVKIILLVLRLLELLVLLFAFLDAISIFSCSGAGLLLYSMYSLRSLLTGHLCPLTDQQKEI